MDRIEKRKKDDNGKRKTDNGEIHRADDHVEHELEEGEEDKEQEEVSQHFLVINLMQIIYIYIGNRFTCLQKRKKNYWPLFSATGQLLIWLLTNPKQQLKIAIKH